MRHGGYEMRGESGSVFMRKSKKVFSGVKCRMLNMKMWFVNAKQWVLVEKKQFVEQESGEGFVDVLVKMLIVVVVGAALLAIMRTAVPNLFTSMMDKIKTIFEV